MKEYIDVKILQIIPAPSNLYVKFKNYDSNEPEMCQVVCLALVEFLDESREIRAIVCGEDSEFYFPDEMSNFIGFHYN